MTPVDPKIRAAAVLAGRAKLGEQHRRKNQSDRDKLRVEVEELRADNERLQDDCKMLALCEGDRKRMAAEIERLQAYANHERSLGAEGPMIELANARQEIERLRAALQQIADDATPGDDNYCSDIARRALEPKP